MPATFRQVKDVTGLLWDKYLNDSLPTGKAEY